MKTLCFLTGLLFCGVVNAAEITGTVQQKDGQPIAGAKVKIYTARMRTGDSPMCPSCWADCAKSALTDAKGQFRIVDVSDNLVFRLLVLAKGYAPDFADKVDPQNGETKIALQARNLSSFKPEQLVHGRIVGPDHEPVVGARVSPLAVQKGLDPMTLTDADGNFVLACAHPVRSNRLCVSAEGYVSTKHAQIAIKGHQPLPVEIALVRGVTLTGRVLKEGEPRAGVTVDAVQVDRGIYTFVGEITATTSQDGSFVIYNAPAKEKMTVSGLMNSFPDGEALPVRQIETGDNETTLKLGDLSVQKSRKIAGRLIRQDGKPFPQGSRVSIGREEAWDSKMVPVGTDGSFAAEGFPEGETLAIYIPGVVLKTNLSLETDENHSSVMVKRKGDVTGLEITFEVKDSETKFAEMNRQIVRDRYGEFFKAENLPPEKIDSFVTSCRMHWDDAQKWEEHGFASFKAAMEEGDRKFYAEMVLLLGEPVAQRWKIFDDEEFGRDIVKELREKHPGDWLTSADQKALVHSLTEALKKGRSAYAAAGVDPIDDPGREEQIKECEAVYQLIIGACTEALPAEKLAIVKEVLEPQQKEQIEAIRKEGR